MRRGPKPRPSRSPALSKGGQPRCPEHLDPVARKEWRRLARPLFEAGILTIADRAALAAYCQAYSRWAEAEAKLQQTPKLIKTPSGYVQQSPWVSIANKQLELMGRYMAELGITPTSRARLPETDAPDPAALPQVVELVWRGPDGILRNDAGPVDEGCGSVIEVAAGDGAD
jgi:phage terminase, small subunit, putative, P27 family